MNVTCKECKDKNREVKYSFEYMQYHMFFSSPEYTEPNVVVVYGNTQYMSSGNEEVDIHSEISYRNMTYSRDTILILMDVTKDLLMKGVRAVNAARPVDQVVLPTKIPCGLSSFTCLQKRR